MQCKLVIDVERGALHVEAPQELVVDLLAWADRTVGLLTIMAKETRGLSLARKGDATGAPAVQ